MNRPLVRNATPDDFSAINEIYNWTIVDNHVSFDIEPWDLERRRRWWDHRDPELDCLVAEHDGGLVGLTYSSWYRPKPAYRSSVETTVVIAADHRGRGHGKVLLSALINRLRDRGFHRAVAIIALPNEASVGLHENLGYTSVGTLTEVGHKLGRHWDTTIMERDLTADGQ